MNDPVNIRRGGSARCAIYTRKSSEEGLEQAFNSLDAQREAREAYILSQKGTGWVALPNLSLHPSQRTQYPSHATMSLRRLSKRSDRR